MSTTTDPPTTVDHSANGCVDLYDDHAAPSTDTITSKRPSRRRWLLAGLGVVAAGAAAGVVVATSGGDDDAVDEPVTIRTATAETADLVEFTDLDGTLSLDPPMWFRAGGLGGGQLVGGRRSRVDS